MPEINNINGLNRVKSQNSIQKNNNISFTGHNLVEDNKGQKYYEFYLPKGIKNATLEIVKLKEDDKGNQIADKLFNDFDQKGELKGHMQVWQVPADEKIAYRFLIDGKPKLDTTGVKTKDGEYLVATNPTRPVLNTPHHMYHLMPDSFNKEGGIEKNNKDGFLITRKHFNRLGGSLKGITEKLKEGYLDGVARVISTPIFGQDNISNHGYWTTNPYQITESMGSLGDFKEMQVELFKKGMGWVADGAFVNEGIQGVHVRDIMMNGVESPYLDWFKLQGFETDGLRFGVLPKEDGNKNAQDSWDIKVVNGPGNGYNPQKPTYVQLFDKRLVDEGFENNQDLINIYLKKRLENNNEITNYRDAVQPLIFRVSPKEVEQKLDKHKEKIKLAQKLGEETPKLRDSLLEWNNFKLTKSDRDGTILLWDGNKDVLKLQFTNPDVKKYILNVGKYWTASVDKALTEYTANSIANVIGEDKSPANVKQVIAELAEKGELPQKASKLVNEEMIKNVLNGEYDLKLPLAKDLNSQLAEYPLEAIEFPEEALSIVSNPEFKEVLSNVENKKNYYSQAETIVKDVIKNDKALSSKLFDDKSNLTEDGKLIFSLVKDDVAKFVAIYSLSDAAPSVDEKGNLAYDVSELKANVYENVNLNLNTHEKASKAVVKTFEDGAIKLANDTQAKEELIKLIQKRTANLDADTIKVAKLILNKTESGLDWRIDASKDIADIDAVKSKDKTFQSAVDEIVDFWSEFNAEVRKHNPKAYTIGELTNIPDLININGGQKNYQDKQEKEVGKARENLVKEAMDILGYKNSFDELDKTEQEDVIEMAKELGDDELGKYDNGGASARLTENYIIDKTGFTTQTNYSYLFSMPPRFVHGANESDFGNETNQNLGEFLSGYFNEYLESGQIDNILYSHTSPGNHDKPRTIDGFTTDTSQFFWGELKHYESTCKKLDKVFGDPWWGASDVSSLRAKAQKVQNSFQNGDWLFNEENKPKLKEAFGESDYEKFKEEYYNLKNFIKENEIKNKAIAKKDALMDALANTDGAYKDLSSKQQKAIEGAIDKLADGEVDSPKIAKRNAEQFATRPFEQNWEDIAKIAGKEVAFDNVDMNKVKKDIMKAFLAPALNKYKAMMSILVGLPCNPTIYAGDELGMTGFETPCKNVHVHNRNRLTFERTEEGKDKVDEIAAFKKFVFSTMSLRNKKAFSPLSNGETVVLGTTADKVDAVYRYNSDTDVIAVFNTNGFDNTRDAVLEDKKQSFSVDMSKLPTDADKNAVYKAVVINQDTGKIEQVKGEFVVKGDKLVQKGNNDIKIAGPAMYFYRAKDGKGKDVSFEGRSAMNANVAVANMKFNIPLATAQKAQSKLNNSNKIALSV